MPKDFLTSVNANALREFFKKNPEWFSCHCLVQEPAAKHCVLTDEFDFNTLHLEEEISESGKKKLRIQKYPDTCGRNLRKQYTLEAARAELTRVRSAGFLDLKDVLYIKNIICNLV